MPEESEPRVYTAADLQRCYFVQAVFLRPKMYTLDGSLAEIFAFLVGFYSGMEQHNPAATSHDVPEVEWYNFIILVAERFGVEDPSSWWDVATALRCRFPDESMACNYMVALYEEYLALLASGNDSKE